MSHQLPGRLLAALVVATLWTSRVAANESVAVELRSGRQFVGAVDSRTDAEHLWLRSGSASLELLRPIAWQQIVTAHRGDERLTPEQLRSAVFPAEQFGRGVRQRPRASEWANSAAVTAMERGPSLLQIHNLVVEAGLGEWDRDAAPDGFWVHLHGWGAENQRAPLYGTVDFELIAPVQHEFHAVPQAGGRTLETVARWSRTLDGRDSGIAKFALPWQALDPDQHHRIGNQGRIRMRMAVPGQGVFERETELLRLRRALAGYWGE